MSSDISRTQSNLENEAAVKRRAAENKSDVQPEAASIDAAVMRGMMTNAANPASTLGQTDSATRARVVTTMQHNQGNAHVQRVLQRDADGAAAGPGDDLADRIQAASG